jgi:hypothetical protein
MNAKEYDKQAKLYLQQSEKYRVELRSRDNATHSEDKAWKYDHKTGSLVNNKEK